MKTVGIVADNYKLDKFKNELDKKGFQYTVVPFTKNTSTIKISVPAVRMMELAQLVQMVNHLFKKSTQN